MQKYISILKFKPQKIKMIKLNYKIAQTGILLALSLVISYFSISIAKIIGMHGIDFSYFLIIAALYIVGYRFTMLIAILHGGATMLISGNWFWSISKYDAISAFSN